MPSKKKSATDVTPAGKLHEAKLHDVMGYQLAQAAIVADGLFMLHVGKPFALRPVEYTLLALIVENPGSSMTQLARALAVTAPNVTVWIDRLEARGLVQRIQSTQDRRSQTLRATAQGIALSNQSTQRILQAEREALSQFSAGEYAILTELLHKLACARSSTLATAKTSA